MTSDWQDYIKARKNGIKKQWKALLADRVSYIDSLDADKQAEYLNDLCHHYFDLGATEIPIQHPDIWNKILEAWKVANIWENSIYLFWLAKALTSTTGSFKGAYLLLNKDPIDILSRVMELDPNNFEAKKILFEQHLHTLDFGMQSIDTGMVIEKYVGDEAITECEKLIKVEPNLKHCKSRFGGDFEYYKSRFLAWYEYSKEDTKLDFDDWYKQKM